MPRARVAVDRLWSLVRGADARYLGIGLAFPTFEVFRRVSLCPTVSLAAIASPGACILSVAVGAAVAIGAAAALEVRAARDAGGPAARARALGLLAAALFAALLASSLAALALGLPACACLSFFSAGAAVVASFVGWAEALYAEGTLRVFLYMAAAALLRAATQPVLDVLSSDVAAVALLVGMGMCSCACLLSLARAGLAARNGDPAAWAATTPEPTPDPGLAASYDGRASDDRAHGLAGASSLFRSSLDAGATGFVLCFFTWGVLAMPPLEYAIDHNAATHILGCAGALCIVGAFVCLFGPDAAYAEIRQRAFFLLPTFALFLAYFSFVRMLGTFGALKDLLSVGYNTAISGFLSLTVGLAVFRCRERGTSVGLAACAVAAACTAVYALGVAAWLALGNNAMYLQVVAATVYALGLSFISTGKASLNDEGMLRERCHDLAERCGLTEREADVVWLLATDHTVARTAERLEIAPDTVRTHRKHAYAKLGVHSLDELKAAVRKG